MFSTAKEVLLTYSYVYAALKSYADEHHLTILRARLPFAPGQTEPPLEALAAYRTGNQQLAAIEAAHMMDRTFRRLGIAWCVLYLPQEGEVDASKFLTTLTALRASPQAYDRKNPHDRIQAFCQANGIPFLSPWAEMEQQLRQGKRLFLRFDRHYNRQGNTWLATWLLQQPEFIAILRRLGHGVFRAMPPIPVASRESPRTRRDG